MKTTELSLFWKYSIAIAITVLFFGSLNLLFIRNQVYRTFEEQIEKHGISIAMSIAERAVEPILYDDISSLNRLLSQTKSVNSDIFYIFILDYNKKIVAHTFKDFIPKSLIELNQIPSNHKFSIQILKDINDNRNIVRDIAIPILDEKVGTVRIGMSEHAFLKDMRSITTLFIGMVLFFLIIGIIGAFVLSYIITKPIKAISTRASQVNFKTLEINPNTTLELDKHFSFRLKNLFNFTDEIDVLTKTFVEMLKRIKNAYQDLKEAQESLFHSEKMASVGTLAAGLAHEINNPLAGIRNCIRRIECNPDNIRQNAEYIMMMSEALEKIEGVVVGMLNFSRKQELIFTEVNIQQLLNNSISLINFQIEQSKIKLVKHFDEQHITIYASPNHLEQVFVNILLNSIDAINERRIEESGIEGKMVVKTSFNDNEVCIKFYDNGTGVPSEKVASIFDPFFTLKKIKQGTGMGLAVSYNIINSHNGQISGSNNPNGGFTISIQLPLSKKFSHA